MTDQPRCDGCRYWEATATVGEGFCHLEQKTITKHAESWCSHFVPLGPTPLDVLRTEVRKEIIILDAGGMDAVANRLRRAIGDA